MKNLYSHYCSVKKSVVTTCNINRLFSSTGFTPHNVPKKSFRQKKIYLTKKKNTRESLTD